MHTRPNVVAAVNPAAGGDGARAVAALEAVGIASVEAVPTTAPGDAADIAYKLATGEAPPDIVVAVGGDGTAGEVAAGLYRATEAGAVGVPPMLVAPAGTGNSVYRGLWNDAPFEQVAEQVLRGEALIRRVDLARVEQNDHVVLLGSGSGLFAATLVTARDLLGTGRDLLMAAAVAAMESYVPYQGRISVDGRTIYEGDVVETIIGGFRYRGGLLNLVPESVLDDGLLDITLVTAAVDMRVFAQAAVNGHVHDVPGIRTARGERFTVERTDGRPLLFEHDGEVMPQTAPACDLHVLPAALTVLTTREPLPWFGRE